MVSNHLLCTLTKSYVLPYINTTSFNVTQCNVNYLPANLNMNQISCACVFHVDDDEDDRFLLQQVFRQYSPACEIKPLANGEELLEALATAPVLPSLILLDLNMPIMGGFEVLRSIRQEPRYDSIPVVVLTTSDQLTDRQMASELKADGFIPKPPTLKQLNQIVLELRQNWLEGKCAAITQPLHTPPTDIPAKSISVK